MQCRDDQIAEAVACHPRGLRHPLQLARIVFGAAERPWIALRLGWALSRLEIAVARSESEGEDIAPERAIPRERDERLAQIAERELPELVHQSPELPPLSDMVTMAVIPHW